MARLPDDLPPQPPLTEAELEDLREHLSKLTPHHVSIEYQMAYMECRMFVSSLPPPAAVQRLVHIYKQLWKWR
jgi:hypothetical protein